MDVYLISGVELVSLKQRSGKTIVDIVSVIVEHQIEVNVGAYHNVSVNYNIGERIHLNTT